MQVDIIITCYNEGELLKESVQSAIDQTYTNKKIIIVDDGSTDTTTLSLLKEFQTLENMEVIHQENNHLSSARNTGIKHSNAELCFVLDADDVLDKTTIEKLVSYYTSNKNLNLGAVTPGVQCFGESDNIFQPKGGDVQNFLANNNACGNSLIVKKVWEEIGGYDESMKSGYEDWEFWIRMTKAGYMVGAVPELLFFYRVKSNSMFTQTLEKHNDIMEYILTKHWDIYSKFAKDVILKLTFQNRNLSSTNELRVKRLLNYISNIYSDKWYRFLNKFR